MSSTSPSSTTLVDTSVNSSSTSSSIPSVLSIRSSSSGSHHSLHSNQSFPSGTILTQQLPLACIPPFKSGLSEEWSEVETCIKRIGFMDETVILYRGIVLEYLFSLQPSTTTATTTTTNINDPKRKLLALYDPQIDSISHQTKRQSCIRSLTTSLMSTSGREAFIRLFHIVGEQLSSTMLVPKFILESTDLRFSTFQHIEEWITELLSMSYTYNSNNIDGIFIPKGCDTSCTVIYDSISRCNHSCVSNCIHYLESEASYQNGNSTNMNNVRINTNNIIHGLTPSTLERMRIQFEMQSTTSAVPSTSSIDITATPFLRSLRSLRPISVGDELTISYLSSQFLVQSTTRRQSSLRTGWSFTCHCSKCQMYDRSRILLCTECKEPMGLEHILPTNDSSVSSMSEELPFTFIQSCQCIIPPEAMQQLFEDEQILEDAFLELRSTVGSSRDPLALCAGFGLSLKTLNILGDTHWIRYEYHQLMNDLYLYLGRKLDRMDATKLTIWYLEKVLLISTPSSIDEARRELTRANVTYDQSSLLIDLTSQKFITPKERISRLYPCIELADAYASYGEQCWSLHVEQESTLSTLLIQRSIYFTQCSIEIYKLCTNGNTNIELAMKKRIFIAKAKSIDIERIIDVGQLSLNSNAPLIPNQMSSLSAISSSLASVSVSPPSSTSTSSSSHQLSCHSSSCPHQSSVTPLAATLLCTRCRSSRYCSRECQKDDWKKHKLVCKTE